MADNFLKIYKGVSYAPQSSAPANPNDGDIYYDSTLNRFRGYQNGSWQDLITDGADGINYITNPGAESGTDGWVTYADAAATSPVDGTGGSPSFVSFARTTTASEILRGDASFKLTKSSGNAQGEGVAFDNFTIDPQDLEKKQQVSFEYKNLDSNYVNGDLKIFVYDVDNATLIGEVTNDDSGEVLVSGANGSAFYGEFIATDSLNYRLIFHIAGTTSANWDISIDRVKVGPTDGQLFSIMENWEDRLAYANSSLLPNNLGSGSGSYSYYLTQRIGDSLRIRFFYGKDGVAGTGTGTVEFPLPDGLIPKSDSGTVTRFLSGGTTFNVDHNITQDTGADQYMATTIRSDAGVSNLKLVRMGTGSTVSGQLIGASAQIFVDVIVPIVGWESTNLVSNNQLTQQTIKAKYHGSTSSVGTGYTDVIQPTKEYDSHNSYNSSTGEFTVPRDGILEIRHGFIGNNVSSSAANDGVTMAVHVNGVLTDQIANFRYQVSSLALTPIGVGGGSVEVKKGDIVTVKSIRTANIGAFSLTGNSDYNWTSFEMKPDFTSFGVLNPKTEILEVETSTGQAFTGNANTFYVPLTSFKLDLTAGTWELHGQFYTDVVTNAGNARIEVAMATSLTPGSGIIRREHSPGTSNTSNANRGGVVTIHIPEYVVTSNVSIYAHVYLLNTSGFSTSSQATFGSIGNSESRMSARRIK